ncbi:hypothetical protein KFL_000140050 [Klebsormidium nitens]|uniref:Uncharacterized protein n=1 Tax=Klebsormidium nitens TaxID=105231 RepID=A0A1Y1HPE6_KLENI|nr:hypothetical protein KFL_000140050 [Klebsormidium nitens]|eukprot:GAQ78486.1 hypothetical protein KFL_000140050 [Klebsormidium nitens]
MQDSEDQPTPLERAPRVRRAAKSEEISERLVTFIEEGCPVRPHKVRPKPIAVWAFQAFLGGLTVQAARKDRWSSATAFAGFSLAAELFGHGIFDPDFPIRIRVDSHAASRQGAAGTALALGLGGEGVGAGLGFFGGASAGEIVWRILSIDLLRR